MDRNVKIIQKWLKG